MQAFGIIFFLVVVNEALIEYFFTPLPSPYKPYMAAVLGVLLCLLYDADLLASLGFAARVPLVGAVLTGLLISRGSNVFNDLVSRLQVVRAPAVPVDVVERAQ